MKKRFAFEYEFSFNELADQYKYTIGGLFLICNLYIQDLHLVLLCFAGQNFETIKGHLSEKYMHQIQFNITITDLSGSFILK